MIRRVQKSEHFTFVVGQAAYRNLRPIKAVTPAT